MPSEIWKVPAAGEDEQAVAPFLVGQDLEVGQQVGGPLDLVEDGPAAEAGQEATGVGPGVFALVGGFQVDVLQVGEGGPAQRRLARLAGPGHGHERVLPEQRHQVGRYLAHDHGPDPIRSCVQSEL